MARENLGIDTRPKRKNKFDFNDFQDQLGRIRKMGGFMSLLDMLPGVSQVKDKLGADEGQFNRIEGIICSMTPFERENPDGINVPRRQRIARGSGVVLAEVSQLIKQFQMMRQMISDWGVDAVICARLKFCDHWGGQRKMLAEELRKESVPVLDLEREYNTAGSGQISTRVQAFLEML